MTDDPAILILPYGHALGPALSSMPLDELSAPLGLPDRLQGRAVGDLAATDHLIIYPKTSAHYRLRWGTRAKVSMILGEPAVIHARHHRLLRLSYRRFHRILTFNQDLIAKLPNARFLPYGTTWVPGWRDLDRTKSEMCSLIASSKRDTDGHRLRHNIVDWIRETDQPVDIMGRGYKPFEQKSDGLAPYRYSVVIENMPEENYFSEKLVDAVLCDTVPIYWGCPNLSDFMDTAGIIQCKDAAGIKAAVQSMSEQDYTARLPALRAIQDKVETYCDIERRAAQTIRDELGCA